MAGRASRQAGQRQSEILNHGFSARGKDLSVNNGCKRVTVVNPGIGDDDGESGGPPLGVP